MSAHDPDKVAEVLRLLVAGASNAFVAKATGLTPGQVAGLRERHLKTDEDKKQKARDARNIRRRARREKARQERDKEKIVDASKSTYRVFYDTSKASKKGARCLWAGCAELPAETGKPFCETHMKLHRRGYI